MEGKVVEGNQEKLVSRDLFLRANDMLDKNTHGYKIHAENDALTLKRFLKCKKCDNYMRGYLVKKKGIHYYKCNTVGCCNNKNAKVLNTYFEKILSHFYLVIDDEQRFIIKQQMVVAYNQAKGDQADTRETLKHELIEIKKKLDRIEERFMIEEITKELYTKYTEKLTKEKHELEMSIAKQGDEGSNLEAKIDGAIDFAENISKYWDSAGYSLKQKIQFRLFPEGITYDSTNDQCRTPKINGVYLRLLCWMQELTQQKSGIPELDLSYTALVDSTRIEPSNLIKT